MESSFIGERGVIKRLVDEGSSAFALLTKAITRLKTDRLNDTSAAGSTHKAATSRV